MSAIDQASSFGAKPGQFCAPVLPPQAMAATLDRPPVLGYNYSQVTLANRLDNTGLQAFPQAVLNQTYTFDNYVSVAGLWMSTSIINPAIDTIGVFVAKDNRPQIAVPLASSIYFHHISISSVTSTRSSGMSFGETAGLLVNPGEAISVYIAGTGADVDIFYAMTIFWLVR